MVDLHLIRWPPLNSIVSCVSDSIVAPALWCKYNRILFCQGNTTYTRQYIWLPRRRYSGRVSHRTQKGSRKNYSCRAINSPVIGWQGNLYRIGTTLKKGWHTLPIQEPRWALRASHILFLLIKKAVPGWLSLDSSGTLEVHWKQYALTLGRDIGPTKGTGPTKVWCCGLGSKALYSPASRPKFSRASN